jgi:hypothetical protein
LRPRISMTAWHDLSAAGATEIKDNWISMTRISI